MKLKLLILINILSLQIFAQKYKNFGSSLFVHNGDSLFYRTAFPDNLQEGKKYPLIVYLHGMGSRGDDNWKQLIHGSKLLKNKSIYNQYPAVILFPQCSDNMMWTHRKVSKINGKRVFSFPVDTAAPLSAELTNMLVDKYLQYDYIDSNRVYIVGMSMGGMGVLEFLYRWADKYAAAAVVCGCHNEKLIDKYCNIPIWFFHGKNDRTVPQEYSQKVYEKLHECNVNSKYTLYKNLAHNCWNAAYSNPDLLKWLNNFTKTLR